MEFLSEMLQDIQLILSDWPVGTIGGVIMIALLMGIVGYGLFCAFDSWFLPRQQGMGRVIEKIFTPAHTTLVTMSTGKTATVTPIHHPDDWSVSVEVGGQEDEISVNKNFYDKLRKDDWVVATYVLGRLSGGLYLKDIYGTLEKEAPCNTSNYSRVSGS